MRLISSGVELCCELIKTCYTSSSNFLIIIEVVNFKCRTLFSDLITIAVLNQKADK